MKKNTFFYQKKLLSYVFCLSLGISLIGCTSNTIIPSTGKETEKTTSSTSSNTKSTTSSDINTTSLLDLANGLKEKYDLQEQYKFADEIHVLERNEVLEVDLGFPITDDHNTYDMFQFFLDPELTIPLWRPAPSNYYKGHDKIKIKPKTYPLFRTEFEGESKRENANWGNAGTLYLAKYYDKSGNVTEEPQEVSVIKIKTELPRPEVNLIADENGFATLSWQPVKGATQYSIYSISIDNNQISADEILYCVDTTKETSFSGFDVFLHDTSSITGVATNSILTINNNFLYDEDGYGEGYVVIAEGPDGQSEMSRVITPNDYAARLIHSRDYDASSKQTTSDPELKLPLYLSIEMCDESSVLYPIEYDASSVQKYTGEHSPTVQVDGKGLAQRMTIIGRPKGTPFEEVFYFYYYPEVENIDQTLNRFLKRQEQLSASASGLGNTMTMETVSTNQDVPTTDSDASISMNQEIPITATNSLSEYLAHNMLNGITTIPLKDFPKATDTNYLSDALLETTYQNPLIFGIESASSNPYTNTLYVTYTLDQSTQEERQELVLKEAQNIIASIITADMTDLQKEEAINDYLCSNLEYDYAALESAEKNNYKYADPEFDDSFTVYGALINKVCVCKGYAEAFKLLADLAGLDSLVVTGQMDSVGHAWNKININNEWLTIDVTNNDKEFMANALYNLPDNTASLMLIENKDYVLDANYKNYVGSSADFEYYRLKGNYYAKSEISQVIATKLTSNTSELTLRTDFDLTDDELYELLQNAVDTIPIPVSFSYYNWLGIVYIKCD